jgi:hypothetical protein
MKSLASSPPTTKLFVSRPHLHRQIKEQLHDKRQDATNTRILVVHGLGGSGVAAGTQLCAGVLRRLLNHLLGGGGTEGVD